MNRFKWMVESVMHNVTHFGRGAVLDLEILWHLDSCLTDWNSADKNFLSWSSSSPLSSYSIPLIISESTKGIYPFEFDQKNFARASWKCHKFSSKICLSHWPGDDCIVTQVTKSRNSEHSNDNFTASQTIKHLCVKPGHLNWLVDGRVRVYSTTTYLGAHYDQAPAKASRQTAAEKPTEYHISDVTPKLLTGNSKTDTEQMHVQSRIL